MTSKSAVVVPIFVAVISSACNRAPAPRATAAGDTAASVSQQPSSQSDSARIELTTARRTALAKVPKSKVVSEELEQEGGRLVYSFDLRQGSSPGIEEVQVDARDGSIVSVKHESPSQQAEEARQDQKRQ
jgi:uncharacterized membrane protein YkoI